MRTIHVNVTQRDIERGHQLSSEFCPVALAAKRHFRDSGIRVRLYYKGAVPPPLNTDPRVVQHDLPDWVDAWMHDFDAGLPVKPIKFSVAVKEVPHA